MRPLNIRVSEELYDAIAEQARVKRSNVSQEARNALWDVFLPDQATIERCATHDPRTEYLVEPRDLGRFRCDGTYITDPVVTECLARRQAEDDDANAT